MMRNHVMMLTTGPKLCSLTHMGPGVKAVGVGVAALAMLLYESLWWETPPGSGPYSPCVSEF